MKNKRTRRAAALCLAALCALSAFMSLRRAAQLRQSEAASAQARALAALPPAPEEEPAPLPEEPPEPPPEEEPEEPDPDRDRLAAVDLEALREVSGDVRGWLEIPGTELSYPLMQGEDNEYYLEHSWNGKPGAAGAVFLDSAAAADLSDPHTLVYGHRMRNGSMFGLLRNYRDAAFWEQHPRVYAVTDGGVLRYDVFAAYEAEIRGPVYQPDPDLEELVRLGLERSVIATGVVPEAGERILTLSTCTGRGYAARWVVQAVLREGGEQAAP